MSVELPEPLLELLRGTSVCFLATVMPDGSPQLTQVWGDTDGRHVLVNTVVSHRKARNVARDPRVAVTVADPADPSRYYALRGQVAGSTTEGAAEHVEQLSQRYLGRPYPNYSGTPEPRLLLTIAVNSIAHAPYG